MKNVTILGSTGSIGRQALEVIAMHPERFRLRGLCAFSSEEAFSWQLQTYKPELAAFSRKIEVPQGVKLLYGEEAASALGADEGTDIFVLAISGFAALKPLLAALQKGKRIAIANKESLVCGGDLVKKALQRGGGELIPVDSEQSAIFQCLQNGRRQEVKRLILTASGGPFFQKKREELKDITPEQAVKHPNWSMGRKISLDSATLFNKGLEVMEAARLFDFGTEEIDVLIHPQSIVHSMVEYRDGTIMSNMSLPDMRLPIQYAMTYPERIASPAKSLLLENTLPLTFVKPDLKRFPALQMAYDCLRAGGGYPVVYNGANEMAASLFFERRIGFLDIEALVKGALDDYANRPMTTLEAVMEADGWARENVLTRANG